MNSNSTINSNTPIISVNAANGNQNNSNNNYTDYDNDISHNKPTTNNTQSITSDNSAVNFYNTKSEITPVKINDTFIKSEREMMDEKEEKEFASNSSDLKLISKMIFKEINDEIGETNINAINSPKHPSIKKETDIKNESITNFFPKTGTNSSDSVEKVRYMPLSHLNTYSRNFTILVRIIKKNEMKQYSNNKGEGNLFSFIMLDTEGTQMECTVFGNLGHRVYDTIKQGLTYEIKGAYIKINDRKYSIVKSDYKLFLEDGVQIKEIKEENLIKQTADCDFIKIAKIEKLETDKNIDIVGRLIDVGDKSSIISKVKGNQEIKKILLIDDSESVVEVTLWGKHILNTLKKGDIIAMKNMKINYYNEKSLNTTDGTVILREEEIPQPYMASLKQFFELKNKTDYELKLKYYKNSNNYIPSLNIGNIWPLADVVKFLEKNNDIINYNEDKVPLFKVKAFVTNFIHSEKYYYLACFECKKKLNEEGGLRCNNCNKIFERPYFVFALNIKIKDCSMDHYINVFGSWA